MSVSPAHKIVFGRLYQSVWNERRLEYIEKVIADTHALDDPTICGGAVGPAAYRRQVERFLTGLPDLKFNVEDTISEKDKLVVAWTISGTHKGILLGVAPSGKKVSFSGITICQIDAGKIIDSRVIWDGLGLLTQLGLQLPVKYELVAISGRYT